MCGSSVCWEQGFKFFVSREHLFDFFLFLQFTNHQNLIEFCRNERVAWCTFLLSFLRKVNLGQMGFNFNADRRFCVSPVFFAFPPWFARWHIISRPANVLYVLQGMNMCIVRILENSKADSNVEKKDIVYWKSCTSRACTMISCAVISPTPNGPPLIKPTVGEMWELDVANQ